MKKLKDSLVIKWIVALAIAISPALIMRSCEKFRNDIILSSDTTVQEHRREIQRQLDCLKLNNK